MVKKLSNPTMKGMRSLKGKGDPYSDAVRAKIKGSCSDKRKRSQKLNALKTGKYKEENVNPAILALISDPQCSAQQIQELIQMAAERDLKDGDFINLINTAIKKHSAIFGTSMKVENTVTNFDRMMGRIEDFKKKEKEASK